MKAFGFLLILLCAVVHCASFREGHKILDEVEFFNYESLLDFQLEYSEKLKPVASLVCAGFDYVEVFLYGETPFHDKFLKLRDSICSAVNSYYRLDLSYLEKCIWGDYEDCWKTGKLEFLMGSTVDKDFFYFVNSSNVVKRKQVAKCLQDEGCSHRDEAVGLLKEWNNIISDCDQMNEEQVVDAVLGAGMPDSMYYEDYEVYQQGYYKGISNCLRITPSDKVKRAISKALNNTAVCSKVLQDHILNYIEEDLQVPFDVVMDLSRKLMSCNNRSVERVFEKMLAERDPDEFSAGSAIWELMKMMNEENELLRQRREDAMPLDRFLSGLVVSPNLKYKWDSNPFIWRYSYKTNSFMRGEAIYSIVAKIGKQLNDPLSITISEVYQYPPLENHLTFAIQSPLLKELVDIMEGKLQNVEDVVNLVQKLISQEGMWYPFKFSTVFMYDDINYDSEQFVTAYYAIMGKVNEMFQQLLDDVPKSGTIKFLNFGDTEASFIFDYTLLTDKASFRATAKTTSGEILFQSHINFDFITNIEGMPGVECTGGLKLLEQYYDFESYFSPMLKMTDDKSNCEMSFIARDKSGDGSKEVVRLSSCARPIYMSSVNEPIEGLTNSYRVLEIPNVLKVNLTMDFGKNGGGVFKFINTPKQMITTIEYANEVILDVGLKLKNVVETEKKRKNTDAPVFITETSAYLKMPTLSRHTGTFKVISGIYDDLSAKSSYHMSSMNAVNGIPLMYDGSFNLTSCSRGAEDFFSNILLKQEMPKMPKKICYDSVLQLPMNKGHVKQLIMYNSKNRDIHYSYDINLDCPFAINGNFTRKGDELEGFNYITAPFPGTFKISSTEFETVPSKNDSLMVQIDVDTTGNYFFINPPQWDPLSMGKPITLVITNGQKFDHVFRSFAEDGTTYAICSFFFEDNQHYKGYRLVCDLETVHGAHLLCNMYGHKLIVNATRNNMGTFYAVVTEERAEANLYDVNSFEYANFTATYNANDKEAIQVFFKPKQFSGNKSQPMCQVLNYEFGSTVARSDTECVQGFMKQMGFEQEDGQFLDNFSEIDVYESGEMLMKAAKENLKTLSIDEIRTVARQNLDMMSIDEFRMVARQYLDMMSIDEFRMVARQYLDMLI